MIFDGLERNNIKRVFWGDIRARVSTIEPTFCQLVDNIAPDESYPVYLVYYPFGAVEADTESSLFPDENGGYFRLTDRSAPKEMCLELGYSINSAPLGMVLDKQLEVYIDSKKDQITAPWLIYKPGMVFPFSSILSVKNHRVYAPNGILSSTAGARSVFMLPNIGCLTNHALLQRGTGIKTPTPKTLYQHWNVFKDIARRNMDWRCCVVYFSEKWVQSLHTDRAWIDLKQYLHELAWIHFEYERNRVYYDMTFSMIQRKRNLRPNPYITDTARHLIATAVGAVPGFVPAENDDALPVNEIQDSYVNHYNLKKYIPTIMIPKHFVYEEKQQPIYYSLNNPSTHISSPKSRDGNTLSDMRELENIIRIYCEELSSLNAPCSDTIMGDIAKIIKFDYFHSKSDSHGIVKMTEEITKVDKRFLASNSSAVFSCDAPFLRGCISISN